MADDERDEPSLELPSLGLRRRRRRAAKESSPEREPEREPETAPPARPLFVEETARSTATASPPVAAPAEPPVEGAAEGESGSGGARRRTRRERREGGVRRERPVRAPGSAGGMAVVLVTGLLVGALTVGLTWLAERGCEAVRGTSSCGDPGLLLLLAVVVVAGLAGAAALRLARVPAPGSTSTLGVGLLAVVALLFLGGSLGEPWAAAVVPVLAVLTFGLAHWVTTHVGEEPGDAA